MKQIVIREQLSKGLRVFENSVRNSAEMLELRNVMAMPIGWVPWKEVSSATINPTPSWPYPQIGTLHGDYYFFLEDSIIPDIGVEVERGGVWHLATLGQSIVATNGACVVVVKGIDEGIVYTRALNSVCSFRGRLILGGCPGLLDFGEEFTGLSSRHVMWLPAVGPGLRLVMDPDGFLAWWNQENGSNDTILDVLRGSMERNDLGFVELDSDVLYVKSVSNGFIAVTRTGVWALSPIGGENPGFGKRKILEVGFNSRMCCGGKDEALLVDASGRHWLIKGNFSVESIYYDGFVSGDVIINWLPRDQAFVISDSNHSYVLTSSGMSEVSEVITAITDGVSEDGSPFGYSYGMQDDSFYAKTGVMDFGLEGIKTVHSVRIMYDCPTRLQVRLNYKDDYSNTFKALPWDDVDALGVVDTPISTSAIFLELYAPSYKNMRIHSITVVFDNVGKQNSKHTFKMIK